jgi:VanZ family protein
MLNRITTRLILTVTWMIVIFIGSSIPGYDVPELPAPDYILHAIEYAVFGGLFFWWRFYDSGNVSRNNSFIGKCLLITVSTGSLYGMIDEIHQAFIPGRSPDIKDWMADILGCLVGAVIALILLSGYERQRCRKISPPY